MPAARLASSALTLICSAGFLLASPSTANAQNTGQRTGPGTGTQTDGQPAARRQPVSVMSVLSRHVRGMGGATIWEETGPMELHLTLISGVENPRSQEATVVIDGPERIRWSQPTAAGPSTDMVRNGAYTWMEGGPSDARRFIRRPMAIAQYRYQTASVNTWVAQLGLWFGRMEVGGFITVNDEPCVRLLLRDRLDDLDPDAPRSATYTAYFNEETGRLVKIELPPGGRMHEPRSLHFSEWKTFGPITVASRTEERVGDQVRVTIIRDVRLGEDVKVSFDVPEAVREQPDPDAPPAAPPTPELGNIRGPATDGPGGEGGSGAGGTGGAGDGSGRRP